jgi:hypothetical protein
VGSGALLMAEPKKAEYCIYVTTKIDVEVLRLVKAAAALSSQSTQDWLSDMLNPIAAKATNQPQVKRKPPPPHPKRPKK